LAINATIRVWQSIMTRVELEKNMEWKEKGRIDQDEWASLDALVSRMTDLPDLTNRINLALEQGDSGISQDPTITNDDQPGPAQITWKYGHSKWVINPE
jgi:hypothetical protein